MNDLVNITPCAVSDPTTTKLRECRFVIRMWQTGENQEASRKILILLSLLKQCYESRDMMLFQRAFPLHLLLDSCSRKALSPLHLQRKYGNRTLNAGGRQKGSLLSILNVLMDAGFIIAGLVCFVFVLLIVGFVMITRTQNK